MIRRCDSRRITICIIFVLLIVQSSCVAGAESVDSTVGDEGTIESYEIQTNMSQEYYDYIKRASQSQGYSSVETYIKNTTLSNINRENVENIVYSESTEGGNKTVTLRFEGYSPSGSSSVSTTKQNGTVVYTDRRFIDASVDYGEEPGKLSVHYTLTMPGKIQNSTADTVEGDTATWDLNGSGASQPPIRAKSKVSSGFGIGGIPDAGDLAPLIVPLVIGAALAYWVR